MDSAGRAPSFRRAGRKKHVVTNTTPKLPLFDGYKLQNDASRADQPCDQLPWAEEIESQPPNVDNSPIVQVDQETNAGQSTQPKLNHKSAGQGEKSPLKQTIGPASHEDNSAASNDRKSQSQNIEPSACMTDREVAAYLSISVAKVWRSKNDEPGFPQPIKIGPGSSRWIRTEVDAYIKARALARSQKPSMESARPDRRTSPKSAGTKKT